MLKNTQSKIISIICITQIILITLVGVASYKATNKASVLIFIAVGILATIIIEMYIYKYISKYVMYPVNKLIESAEEIKGEEKGNKKEKKNTKKTNENLENVIDAMTIELKDKLSEVSTQKNQIETILLHMTDGIIAFNRAGEIILINPAAKKLLSIGPEDNTFEDIFAKFKLDINMEKIIYLENWTSTEQRIQVEERYVNVFFAPFKDEKERPEGVIAVIQDITEHVKLDNMQKEFVADVSHELKTPITSIMGYADTLLETDHDKEIETKFLGVISSEAKRMSKLVTDLLSLSRFDSNKTNIVKEEFDLGELAKKCQEKLQIEIDKKHLQVHCLVTANVPPVYAEKDGIERVIINILSNSIKYTNENGTINIYVGFVYNDAYIKFIDTGIGIPEEDLERIFERFYRVDKARTREMGGTGLGLSIAKEILDRNNGTIDIKSKLNEGTEVVIRIPTKTNNKFILKEEENLNEGEARRQPNIQEQKDN